MGEAYIKVKIETDGKYCGEGCPILRIGYYHCLAFDAQIEFKMDNTCSYIRCQACLDLEIKEPETKSDPPIGHMNF